MTVPDLIAEGRAKLAATNTGTLEVYDANSGDGQPPRPLWSIGNEALEDEADDGDPVNIIIDSGGREHADLIAWAINNLPALLDEVQSLRDRLDEVDVVLLTFDEDYPTGAEGVRTVIGEALAHVRTIHAYRDAMRVVRRIFADFGVTNPPPRLAALLEEGNHE
jgi:hypothetical protein